MAVDRGLTGKVVLITGANHGIGAATAKAFALEQALVFITFLRLQRQPPLGSDAEIPGQAYYFARQAETADRVLQSIRSHGGIAEAVEADLAIPGNIPLIFDQAEATLGRVAILVNNAAYCASDTFVPDSDVRQMMENKERRWVDYGQHQISADSHDLHFAVNSRAVALMMAEYTRRHVAAGAHWGRIINISTDAASAHPTEVSYGASKYAMESYSHAAANELASYGITVNIVAPGPIQTGYIPPDVEKEISARIPFGRVGQPEDVADAIVLLASEQARWITGQKIYVGGGNKMPR
jgi:3-oxoacyl-[acyl-carrier protein] reductase